LSTMIVSNDSEGKVCSSRLRKAFFSSSYLLKVEMITDILMLSICCFRLSFTAVDVFII